VADVNHNFPKDSSIQLFWRFDAENLQNCWRQVDITTREIIPFATLKIWAGSNQCVVHVESAECSVSPLSCRSLPIRVDHPRDIELIFEASQRNAITTSGARSLWMFACSSAKVPSIGCFVKITPAKSDCCKNSTRRRATVESCPVT